ncbi:MAG: rod shape-determining protein [Lachnospiraceae bacterium]|nr:rod shape-determining protein [Lachnospiraceae bacterium]
MAGNTFGIDLGTSNIKIYNYSKKQILNERNMIAIERGDIIYATGDMAFDMYERTPDSIQVSSPINNGVIADIDSMQELLKKMLTKAAGNSLRSSNYIMAVPTDITEVEKRAFYDLIRMTGVKEKKVLFVEKPIADALGVGLDVNHAQGIMVINIGADTTEISVLSLGGIVLSKLIKTGGNKFDEAITAMIKKEYNLIIGRKTAETLKKHLCSLDSEQAQSMTIIGRDVMSGLPIEQEITSYVLEEAMEEQFHVIVDAAKMILERTPPELAADIIDEGIYLTGGSSNLAKLVDMVALATELETNVYNNPDESVIRGIERIIAEKAFSKLATEMREKIYY